MKTTTPAPKAPAHAKFSPSGADRWLSCPGSITLAEQAPPEVESRYAAEGTEAHTCLELFLKNGKAKRAATEKLLLASHDKDMVGHAKDAADHIWERHAEAGEGAELHSERKADLTHLGADLWGTTDATVLEQFGPLTVLDYKYGAGHPVDAEGNPQLKTYAVGLRREYEIKGWDFTEVRLVVIQPRADHHTGTTIREAVVSLKELDEWEKVLADGITAAQDPLAELVPGDHCRWCRAKSICPEISTKALKDAQVDFAEVVEHGAVAVAFDAVPTPTLLTPERLGKTLTACDLIEQWISAVRDHARGVLEKGGDVPGFKLVPTQAKRQWIDEGRAAKEAKKAFGGKAFTEPELKSPAQLEKTKGVGKEWVAARVVKHSSGLKMVPESAPGIATTRADKDFDVVDVTATDKTLAPAPERGKNNAKPKPKAKPQANAAARGKGKRTKR